MSLLILEHLTKQNPMKNLLFSFIILFIIPNIVVGQSDYKNPIKTLELPEQVFNRPATKTTSYSFEENSFTVRFSVTMYKAPDSVSTSQQLYDHYLANNDDVDVIPDSFTTRVAFIAKQPAVFTQLENTYLNEEEIYLFYKGQAYVFRYAIFGEGYKATVFKKYYKDFLEYLLAIQIIE